MPNSPLTAETIFPGIGAWKLGRLIGVIMHCLPLPVGRMKLSTLVFALPLAPLAATLYLLQKVIGKRYRLTSDSLDELPGIGDEVKESVPVSSIDDISIDVQRGQRFHRAGDLVLLDASGNELLTLAGIPRPERVKAAILDVATSQKQLADVASLLAVRPSVEELKAKAAAEKAEADAKKAAAATAKGE